MAEEEDDARFFSPTGCRKTRDGEEIIKLTVTKMPMEWGAWVADETVLCEV